MPRIWIAGMLLVATPAMANREASCATEAQHSRFRAFSERLASAPSTERAQEVANHKLRLGHQAVDTASQVVGDAKSLEEARGRLDDLQLAVDTAESPAQVAAAFDRLERQALRCEYDKVEVAIIVLGFILGIIPGIIFLFLFC